jgi:hypothetical protein
MAGRSHGNSQTTQAAAKKKKGIQGELHNLRRRQWGRRRRNMYGSDQEKSKEGGPDRSVK